MPPRRSRTQIFARRSSFLDPGAKHRSMLPNGMAKRVIAVVGARPNFMKMAPVVDALRKSDFEVLLVHTGQHYDANMSDVFFRDLEMPSPDVFLGAGSGTHAQQTAKVMIAMEELLGR